MDGRAQAGSRPISGADETEIRERMKCSLIRDLCPDADAFPHKCKRCYVFEIYQKIYRRNQSEHEICASQ